MRNTLKDLYLLPIFGGEFKSGYHTEGDIVTTTIDGIDLNMLWGEFQATMQIYTEQMQSLVQLLTYPVANLVENIPVVTEATFEAASEFGVPESGRVGVSYTQLGFDFHDYDKATRFTWKFLRDADARQIEAIHQEYLRADQRLVFRKVMEALFDNRNRKADIHAQVYNVYPLYNGDGVVPPPYKGTTFVGTHSHYVVTNAALIDADDLEGAYDHIAEHGFSIENGTTIICLMNKAEIKEVRKFRMGIAGNNGVIPAYDFIPAANQPALIVPNAEGLLGSRPADTWNGYRVTGSYGDILIVEESYIPAGYFVTFATGGAGDAQNLVGLREHQNAAYRGLRLLPGNQQRYPLVESFYSRGFGTGIRQRGAAVITQVKVGIPSSYVIPTQYKNGSGLV